MNVKKTKNEPNMISNQRQHQQLKQEHDYHQDQQTTVMRNSDRDHGIDTANTADTAAAAMKPSEGTRREQFLQQFMSVANCTDIYRAEEYYVDSGGDVELALNLFLGAGEASSSSSSSRSSTHKRRQQRSQQQRSDNIPRTRAHRQRQTRTQQKSRMPHHDDDNDEDGDGDDDISDLSFKLATTRKGQATSLLKRVNGGKQRMQRTHSTMTPRSSSNIDLVRNIERGNDNDGGRGSGGVAPMQKVASVGSNFKKRKLSSSMNLGPKLKFKRPALSRLQIDTNANRMSDMARQTKISMTIRASEVDTLLQKWIPQSSTEEQRRFYRAWIRSMLHDPKKRAQLLYKPLLLRNGPIDLHRLFLHVQSQGGYRAIKGSADKVCICHEHYSSVVLPVCYTHTIHFFLSESLNLLVGYNQRAHAGTSWTKNSPGQCVPHATLRF